MENKSALEMFKELGYEVIDKKGDDITLERKVTPHTSFYFVILPSPNVFFKEDREGSQRPINVKEAKAAIKYLEELEENEKR